MCTVLLSQHSQSIDDGVIGSSDVHEGFREGVMITQLQLLIAADNGRCGLSFSWLNCGMHELVAGLSPSLSYCLFFPSLFSHLYFSPFFLYDFHLG